VVTRLSWLVFGAGAIGTYVGGSLQLQGEKVVFLEQSEASSFLWEKGLKLAIGGQEYRILHPEIFSTMDAALSYSSYDVIIFALKSYDTQMGIEMLRPFAKELPPVLCLQNGVENEAALARLLGEDRVIAGTVTGAVSRRGPGDIYLERKRGMGIARGHPLSTRIAQALSNAHLNANLYNSPMAMKWSKMLTNLLANASSAILDMTPNQILRNPHLYRVEVSQIREAIAVMQALKLKVVNLPGVPVRQFAWAINHLPPGVSQAIIARIAGGGRGEKMPSFHIDLHAGRGKSEVDYLNGAVVRFGQVTGIPTPINNWLNQTLLDLVQGSLATDEYSHQPDKFLRTIYISDDID
jgi:2-dehydropantoate 2-reductase